MSAEWWLVSSGLCSACCQSVRVTPWWTVECGLVTSRRRHCDVVVVIFVVQLQRRAEQMKKNLEQQEKELEEKMKAFEAEREAWEEQYKPDEYVDCQLHIFYYSSITYL